MGKREKTTKKHMSGKKDAAILFEESPPAESGAMGTIRGIPDAVRSDFYLQVLLVLTIIGIFLRFYNLGFNSLWLDEAFTYNASRGSIFEIWETTKTGDFHPPLFHWIEHIMLYFGNNETVLRFVPAVAGSLSIPLFFLFGKEVMNKQVGLISAALLTFSPFHLYYSQEAYSYSLVVLIFTLILIFYIRALRDDRRNDWIIVGLLSALGFWVHYYIAIPIAVLFIHAFITKVSRKKIDLRTLKNPLLSIVLFLIFISPLIYIVIERFFTLTAKPPTYGVFGLALITETFTRFSALNGLIAILFVSLFIIGLIPLYKTNKTYCSFFILMITLPLLFSVIISPRMTMNPRYLLYLMAIFYTGIACSCCMLPKLSSKKWGVILIIMGVIALNISMILGYHQSVVKDDWRTYSNALAESTREGDFIILIPGYNELPFKYYYNRAADRTEVFGAVTPQDIEGIISKRGNNSVYYVVTNDITAANPEGETYNWLNKNAQYLGQYTNIYTFIS
ncbi:MAG: glycosyltransferase family 39 protein [Methanolinea sp.]